MENEQHNFNVKHCVDIQVAPYDDQRVGDACGTVDLMYITEKPESATKSDGVYNPSSPSLVLVQRRNAASLESTTPFDFMSDASVLFRASRSSVRGCLSCEQI